ncbi:platelet-activating factor receptor isoform X3 [Esox lucius]|uniref:platelet-activating factor receptor isoform X2 n=2 Tax=Esox lucius TaxID=8010 RepID=UPI00147768E7|nr:platelet-activating factor receptor isoform X2 [Esox lucius]XP_028981417.2 platelet-activating factor receptor isoform X1 [Esox lucius]XP_034153259.1 platelet-activating factor receptor isoform X3 [Esox lucius]
MEPIVKMVLKGNTSNDNTFFLDSEFRYTLFPVFYSIVFILGLTANSYVLFVLHRLREAQTMNEIRIYMTNLTVADLLFVCALPFWIDYFLRRGDWKYSDILCRVSGTFFFINTYCSVLFLTAISVNRYWAVTCPLDAASSNCWRRGALISTMIWVLTLSFSVVYLVKPAVNKDQANVNRCFEGYHEDSEDSKRLVAITHLVIVSCFFLVFFIVVACNLLIARALLIQSPSQALGSISAKPRGVKPQALQMLCVVVVVFIVCFLPHHLVQYPWTLAVLQIQEGWGSTRWNDTTRRWLNDAHQITLMLMGLNCLLDPVVYCFATRRFRLYIKDHLKRVGKGKHCSDTIATHISMTSQGLHNEQRSLKA